MGTRYLLDTNICVFLMRGKYDVDKRIFNVGIDNCCISEITVAELLYGAECSSNPESNRRLVNDFCNDMEIIPISGTLSLYANQKADLRKRGLPIDDFDLLIACGAMSHDLILVSDNTKHFDRLPVTLQNWIERE